MGKNVNNGKLFEQQIERIYRLLETDKSAIITWNNKIYSDIDPKCLRQIDITIERNNKITHIECRNHKKPQDVQWIENLIGRKITLKPDLMIAVSNSGFTSTAILTAKKHGIILRELEDLTENEIIEWGRQVTAKLEYIVYDKVEFFVILGKEAMNKIETEKIAEKLQKNNIHEDILIETQKRILNQKINKKSKYLLSYEPEDLLIDKCKIKDILFLTEMHIEKHDVDLCSVKVFGDPLIPTTEKKTYIQKMGLKGFEISKCENEFYILIDYSSIIPPVKSQFLSIIFDLKNKYNKIKGFEIYAPKLPGIKLGQVKLQPLYGDREIIKKEILKQMGNVKSI